MKKFVKKALVCTALAIMAVSNTPGEAAKEVPSDIYEWVHATARQGYFFNKQQLQYGVDDKGFIDLEQLIAPTLRIYDEVQIQDVIAKRRWRLQPVDRYYNLVGVAEYLQFDLDKGIVKVTARDELDKDWGTIAHYENVREIKLADLSDKDAEGIFFKAIIEYAKSHQAELINQSKGVLSAADEKKLAATDKASVGEDKKDSKNKSKKSKKSKKGS